MFWFVELKLNSPGTFTGKNIASHADVLRGSSRVPAPRTADFTEKKNVDQSQQTSRSEKCTLDLEKFRA